MNIYYIAGYYLFGYIWAYNFARFLTFRIRGHWGWKRGDRRIALITSLGSVVTILAHTLSIIAIEVIKRKGDNQEPSSW